MGKRQLKAAAALAAMMLVTATPAMAQDTAELSVIADLAESAGDGIPLYLEVSVNGRPTNLVAEFSLDPATGRIAAPRSELEQIGLRPARALGARVDLQAMTGVSYAYDEAAQRIDIRAPLSLLQAEVVSAMPGDDLLAPDRSFGAILNYSLDADYQRLSGVGTVSSAAAGLDGWVFSPLGTLRSTGVVRQAPGTATQTLRLETTYQVSSPARRLTFALGDVQSSSLAWTRSVRMGGVQLRRDFGLRGDLVTQQLLSFDGAAAVPSTVDVFIDNNRTYSAGREAGPFRLEDLPARSGPGEALIVVTDANGRRTTKAVSFYVSQKLLKKGLADFSVEAGRAREGYGLDSTRYGDDGILSASLRFGLTERITLESNLQLKSDLKLFGLGLTTVPFNLAEVSLAAGASDYRGRKAGFAYGAVQTRMGRVDLNGSFRWSQEGHADLAYATGVDYLGTAAIAGNASLLETPRTQAALGLSLPVTAAANLGLGYVASRRSNSQDKLVTASFGQDLPGVNGSLSVYGAHDLMSGDTRAAMGVTINLGKRRTLRSTASADGQGGVVGGLHIARGISDRHGDYGYSAEVQRDRAGRIAFSGQGEYLGRYGKAGVTLRSGNGTAGLRAQFDGAVAIAGGAVAMGNRVSDSFAIVDAGAAGVPVSVHNRPVTRTGPGGKALVTGLQAHRRNRVSIDVGALPPEVALDATAMDVVPGIGSGVRVQFGGQTETSAVVILRDAAGNPLEAGGLAFLNGRAEEFFVGFGGETLVQDLRGRNSLKVRTETGTCTASFAFAPRPGPMQVIDGVTCR